MKLLKTILTTLLFWGALQAQAAEYPGVTSAFRSAELAFAVAGKVQSIAVKEGAIVEQGQSLIVLYNLVQSLEVKRKYLIYTSKAELHAAINREQALKAQLESTQVLFERGAVSAEDMQKRELDYIAAVAAKEQLSIREQVEEVEYALAKSELSFRTLTAPFSGVVTRIIKEMGESVEANQPILKLVDLSQGYVVSNIAPEVAATLSEGQLIDIHVQGLDMFKGKVMFISPEIDPASGLLQVKAAYENHKHLVRPGIAASLILPDN